MTREAATGTTVRFARHTEQLEQCVAFWRDELGLPEIGRFEDHAGYDGVILVIPGPGAHLEITAGGGVDAPRPHPETLVVLYLGSWEAVRERAQRLSRPPIEPSNPYWERHALTFEDPDGFRVVLAATSWSP